VFNVKRNPSVWFNTSEFVRSSALAPNGYNVRMFPQVIDGLRNDVINMWHGNIMRNFKIREKANLQLRMNMYDIFNRSEFNGPDATPTDSTFGACTTNFGSNRSIEIQGRITF
jgi:hypothetical protein